MKESTLNPTQLAVSKLKTPLTLVSLGYNQQYVLSVADAVTIIEALDRSLAVEDKYCNADTYGDDNAGYKLILKPKAKSDITMRLLKAEEILDPSDFPEPIVKE